MLPLNIARIDSPDADRAVDALRECITALPRMLSTMPLFVDVVDGSLDVQAFVLEARRRQIYPAVMLGGTPGQVRAAHACGLATSEAGGGGKSRPAAEVPPVEQAVESAPAQPEPQEQPPAAAEAIATSLLVDKPVRSGQQVYAQGDLLITASVSAGAEVIAEGNIHVYGALRGRALAGVKGNTDARIFCSQLGAELVSIAGHYRVAEDLESRHMGRAVQVRLEQEKLIVERQGK